jgi:trehalose 6-phosphate phosphatase
LAALLPVAVITGRDAEDVGPRLGFTASAIVGNHGADHWLPHPDSRESWYSAVQWLRDRAQWLALWGVQVEFKQRSVALHYRQAHDAAQALRAIQSCLAVAPAGWESFGGVCVINLVPEGAPSKADAVLELMARWACTSCIYVGDDINDEPVFRAGIAGLLSVRVGMSQDSAAEYGLAGHGDVQYLIDLMLEFRNAASTAP